MEINQVNKPSNSGDKITSNTKVFISNKSFFYDHMNQFCDHHNINLTTINDEDSRLWMRDFFIKDANNNTYIYQVQNNKNYFGQLISESLNNNLFLTENKYIGSLYSSNTIIAKARHNFPDNEFYNNFNSQKFKQNTTDLEGGNLITTENKQFIVGRNAVIATAARNKIYGNDGSKKNVKLAIINLLENQSILNPEDIQECSRSKDSIITFIPQWAYHIDLQMSYIGNNIFLVHSFEESHKFLLNNKQMLIVALGEMIINNKSFQIKPSKEEIKANKANITEYIRIEKQKYAKKQAEEIYCKLLTINEINHNKHESTIAKICQKLQNKGFTVQKYCGMMALGEFQNGEIDRSTSCIKDIDDGLLLLFLFTNSINANTNNESYLLMSSSKNEFKRITEPYISLILQQYGVKPYFLSTNSNDDTIMHLISKTAGALRCQINTDL